MIYARKLKPDILKHLDNDLTIVVTGMRRVGKTFLLQDIYDGLKTANKVFLDLEKPENREIFQEKNFDLIIHNLKLMGLSLTEKIPGQKLNRQHRSYIFLDEIQLVKTLPSLIKFLSDHYGVKFLVSGSSSFYLKNLFSESLSGRKIIFQLHSLDFGEFLIFKNVYHGPFAASFDELLKFNTKMVALKYGSWFEEYLKTGGFPQAVLETNPQKRTSLLKDILDSYLNVDVKSLSNFKQIDELKKLVCLLPARIGQKIDISRLASEVGIARITIKNYLRFLEQTFVINLISPYSKSPDREISLMPKLYFCDTGLAAILAEISGGQKLENVVFSHLTRRFNLNYYQKKSGAEIDFIVNKKLCFEVKTFATKSDYKKTSKICQSLRLEKTYILSQKLNEMPPKFILPAFLLGFLA